MAQETDTDQIQIQPVWRHSFVSIRWIMIVIWVAVIGWLVILRCVQPCGIKRCITTGFLITWRFYVGWSAVGRWYFVTRGHIVIRWSTRRLVAIKCFIIIVWFLIVIWWLVFARNLVQMAPVFPGVNRVNQNMTAMRVLATSNETFPLKWEIKF